VKVDKKQQKATLFYHRHGREVYTYSLRCLGRHEQAEEATQEVFLRLYRAFERDGYCEEGKERAWVMSISRNIVRDMIRLRQKKPVTVSIKAAEEVTDENRDSGFDETVQKALDELSENERFVVVMRHYLNMPFDEIARALDAPGGTVRSWMSRALDKLAARLKKELER